MVDRAWNLAIMELSALISLEWDLDWLWGFVGFGRQFGRMMKYELMAMFGIEHWIQLSFWQCF